MRVSSLKNKSRMLASKYEVQFGQIELLKVAGSSLTRLLVKKGYLTEKELLESFIDEVTNKMKESE